MRKFKFKLNRGMTYVELIVVLSIFSIMSSVIIFNHKNFQAKIDIKNLANDIALQIVQAQKGALTGLWSNGAGVDWKPAYGVYFNPSASLDTDGIAFNKKFIYFADLDNGNDYDGLSSCSGECLSKINITKGNFISGFTKTGGSGTCSSNTDLNAVFTRPDASAKISANLSACTLISDAEITISSSNAVTAKIKINAFGKVQIN